MKKNIKVVQDEEKPIPVEVMAESIKAISEGIKKLRSSRLNDKCLLLLIQHATPLTPRPSMTEIRAILDGIESIEHEYLRK